MKVKTLFCVLVGAILAMSSWAATAQQNLFVRLHAASDISIEVPQHWLIVKRESMQNQLAAAKAIAEQARLKIGQGTKEILLQVDATPIPSRARISLSTTTPAPYTREYLQGMPDDELRSITEQIKSIFDRPGMPRGGTLIDVSPSRITSHRGSPMLVVSYARQDLREPVIWRVTQYKIHRGSQLVELTVSHTESESALWDPILEKVRASLIFE